jgi:hypothetical protein
MTHLTGIYYNAAAVQWFLIQVRGSPKEALPRMFAPVILPETAIALKTWQARHWNPESASYEPLDANGANTKLGFFLHG